MSQQLVAQKPAYTMEYTQASPCRILFFQGLKIRCDMFGNPGKKHTLSIRRDYFVPPLRQSREGSNLYATLIGGWFRRGEGVGLLVDRGWLVGFPVHRRKWLQIM